MTQLADLMYSSKAAPFLVTETNAGSIGFSSTNASPYDGQWRQMAWLLVARGARMIQYWHWNTLPYGAETYRGGVLPHSGVPGRAYREIARIGPELRAAGGAFATAEPDYDIAVLYDSDSKFALFHAGPAAGSADHGPRNRTGADRGRVRPGHLRREAAAADRPRPAAAALARRRPRSRGGGGAVSRAPVAAALYTAADEDLDFLVAYARAKAGIWSSARGPATATSRPGRAPNRAPARMSAAAGAWYEEFVTLKDALPVDGRLAGSATGVAEGLVAERCRKSWPATATRTWADGRRSPPRRPERAGSRWSAPFPTSSWPPPWPAGWWPCRSPGGRPTTR